MLTRRRPSPTPTSPSSSGSVRPSGSGCSPRAATPTRSEVARTHTLAEIRAGLSGPGGRHRDRPDRRRRGPGGVRPQLGKAVLRDPAGGRRHPAAGDDQPGRGRPGIARRMEGRRRPRRHRVRPRRGDQFPARRTICAGRFLANRFQGAAAAAGRAQGDERRVAGAAALCRSDRPSGGPHRSPASGSRWCAPCARRWSGAASSRSRRRCCRRWPAARRPVRSSPTPMRSTPTCTCGSHRNCS